MKNDLKKNLDGVKSPVRTEKKNKEIITKSYISFSILSKKLSVLFKSFISKTLYVFEFVRLNFFEWIEASWLSIIRYPFFSLVVFSCFFVYWGGWESVFRQIDFPEPAKLAVFKEINQNVIEFSSSIGPWRDKV
jgi:hypothetical protein